MGFEIVLKNLNVNTKRRIDGTFCGDDRIELCDDGKDSFDVL